MTYKKHLSFIYSFLLALTPMFNVFRFYIRSLTGLHVVLIQYLPLLLICLIYLGTSKGKIKIGIFEKFYLIVFCYGLITLVWSPDIETGIKWLLNLGIGIILGMILSDDNFLEKKLILLPISILCTSALLLPSVVQKYPMDVTIVTTQRIPYYFGDINIGPNGWGHNIIIACIILLLLKSKKQISYIFFLILITLLLAFMQLTNSRSNVYTMLALLVLYCLVNGWNKSKYQLNKIIISLILFIVAISLIIVIFPYLGNRIKVFDLNGRSQIWLGALKIWKNKLHIFKMIFGVGTGGPGVALAQNWDASYGYIITQSHLSTHNLLLEVMLGWGIIGGLCYIIWLSYLGIIFLSHSREPYYLFVFFLLILGFATHMLANLEYSIVLGFILSGTKRFYKFKYMNINKNKEKYDILS